MFELDSLLRYGFFPKELPPPFATDQFADFVTSVRKFVAAPSPSAKYLISTPPRATIWPGPGT